MHRRFRARKILEDDGLAALEFVDQELGDEHLEAMPVGSPFGLRSWAEKVRSRPSSSRRHLASRPHAGHTSCRPIASGSSWKTRSPRSSP